METTHGRKVIRKQKNDIARRRFMIFTAIILLLGIFIGSLGHAVFSPKKKTQVTSNDDLMKYVNMYGSYDGRIFNQEVSRDWGADDLDFTPLKCDLDEATQEYIFYLCAGYDIDWTLVMAMIQVESSFKADSVSTTGDYGLMQINKMNHEWLTETIGVTDYLDSEQNVRAGIFVLRKLFEEYTDPELVLMAYNMGSTGASKLWEKGIYSTSYSEKVLKIQQGFENQLKGE